MNYSTKSQGFERKPSEAMCLRLLRKNWPQKNHPSVDFFEITATIMIMLVLDSPNITIGCEVRVMRDNGGAGVRAHKEYREVCLD